MFSRYLLILLIVMTLSFGCSRDKPEHGEVLASINDYRLYLDDFQRQLADELELDHEFKITRKAREGFLEDSIKKELLIQEAKRYRLDREEKFIRTIERYWESTLIRNLMEKKGQEIEKSIVVLPEEVDDYYQKMKQSRDNLPPLEDMRAEISRTIREEKKTRRLGAWIDDLRKKAEVETHPELLDKP